MAAFFVGEDDTSNSHFQTCPVRCVRNRQTRASELCPSTPDFGRSPSAFYVMPRDGGKFVKQSRFSKAQSPSWRASKADMTCNRNGIPSSRSLHVYGPLVQTTHESEPVDSYLEEGR